MLLNFNVIVNIYFSFTLPSGISNLIQNFKGDKCKYTFFSNLIFLANFALIVAHIWIFQLTMEEVCSLKPLHPGLSPAVFRDLHWSEISEAATCPCWRLLLTDLKPGQRAMLYSAMQEVTALFCFGASLFSLKHPHLYLWKPLTAKTTLFSQLRKMSASLNENSTPATFAHS